MILFLPLFHIFLCFMVVASDGGNDDNKLIEKGFTYYFMLSLATFIYGTFSWFKYGSWGSVTPYFLLELIASISDNDRITNDVSTFVLEDSAWIGVQIIATAYMNINLGWSYLFVALFALFMAPSKTSST